MRTLDCRDSRQCWTATGLLQQTYGPALAQALLDVWREPPPEALARLQILVAYRPELRSRVIDGWVSVGRRSAGPLLEVIRRPEEWTALWAAEALGRIAEFAPEARRSFEALWDAGDGPGRLVASVGLARLGDARGLPTLIPALAGWWREERLAAAGALEALRERAAAALPALALLATRDPDPYVAAACREACYAIDRALREAPVELEAAPPPVGTGTEPEAAPAPLGRGTEPEASVEPRHTGGV